MGVHVCELGEDELQVFADIEQATAERRNFEYRGEASYPQVQASLWQVKPTSWWRRFTSANTLPT